MNRESVRRDVRRIKRAVGTRSEPVYEAAIRRMQLRCALLSDDSKVRMAAHRSLGHDTEEREHADLEMIRRHGIESYRRIGSDFVHFYRLRERLLAQRDQRDGKRGGEEALDRWRRSLMAATELPADVPIQAVLRELALEPGYADLAGIVKDLHKYEMPPIDPRTFVEVPQLMGKAGVLWPKVMEALVELNSGRYVEAVITGGIGCGKTTLALYTTGYQLYLLSLMRDPHGEHGLDPSTEILIVFQSITAHAARSVDYRRFRGMLESSPYFTHEYAFSPDIESETTFPRRVVVRPVSGENTAAIGENVIGGVLDEMNYMEVVDRSRRAIGGDGTYDQAVEAYQAVVRRRKSRFMKRGELPGVLCLVSSRRYPGQFTDAKEQEAETDPTIYVYDRRSWDVRPEGSYSGKTFRVFVGDGARNPRILGEGEPPPGGAADYVLDVPVEYLRDFESDLMAALRDIAGVSTYARHPFFMNVEAVADCFGKVESVLSRECCDFQNVGLRIRPNRIRSPNEPRFAHVDLARVSDSAAVAVGYVERFVRVARSDDDVGYETLPVIVLDLILEVRPPPAGEINFAKIRTLFYKLRDCGMNLKWITYDSYQSTDSTQILRQKGFMTGELSVDKTTKPYDVLKQAIYDRRLVTPEHTKAREELLRLERDAKTGKIDHPVRGSKDCSDAIAGAVFGITMRREVWARHDVSPIEYPASVIHAAATHYPSTDARDEF